MTVFEYAQATLAESVKRAPGDVAPWWVTLIVGIALLLGGVALYLRNTSRVVRERAGEPGDALQRDWSRLGPIVICGVGLWVILYGVDVF